MKVKICGLRDAATLEQMKELAVDYIGFVFAESKRKVTKEQAAEMLRVGRKSFAGEAPEFVGVFVNPDFSELEQLMQTAPLDVIQLHGQESPEMCRRIRAAFSVKVWKVISVTERLELNRDVLESYSGVIDGLLLDTYDPQYGGGSGQTFNWEVIPVYRDWAREEGIPLFVAGGLNVLNVEKLSTLYRPNGVDVSSGVETDGVKDLAKMKAFIERVKFNV